MTRTILALFVVLGIALAACAAPTPTPTAEVQEDYTPIISVTGEVAPAVWANVSPQAGGVVIEVTVEPGQVVAAGDVLVRLDPTDAQLAVQQAEAALETARAQLALLEAGPRAEQIAVAEAQVEAARAAISQTIAQRNQVFAGATQAEIAAAEAQVAAAEAQQLQARQAHDETMKCYDMPDGSKVCPALGKYEEQARYALGAADKALAAAQVQLAAVKAGAPRAQREAAEAAVAAAQAQARIAEAQLALARSGPTAAEVAVARAAVTQAEAALEAARAALARCEVHAPFVGTVGAVNVRVGETVMPGQPLVTLGDLTTLRIETTDLDEIDVARVTVGQKATVTFDALPERVFTGRVARVSPMAATGGGGVNYTVIVEMDALDPAIRWGMTAFVDIEVGSGEWGVGSGE